MFQYITFTVLLTIAAAAPGFLETHHVVHQPVLAKVGAVVHSAPVATSHQSITQVHNNAHIVTPILKTVTVVKTLAATLPVIHSVHHVAAPAVVKAVHAAPAVHFVHAVPAVAYHVPAAVSHQNHVQIHQNKAIITPVYASVVPVVHAAPIVKTVVAAPVAHIVHH